MIQPCNRLCHVVPISVIDIATAVGHSAITITSNGPRKMEKISNTIEEMIRIGPRTNRMNPDNCPNAAADTKLAAPPGPDPVD